MRDKGLTVFSLSSPEHAATEVDLFVETPFDFEHEYQRAERFELAPASSPPSSASTASSP